MADVQFQNTTSIQKIELGKVQTVENVRISVKSDIADVLSVGVESTVNSYTAEEGEVSFFGKTNVKFLYNDGTGLAASNYFADFTAGLQNDAITSGCKMCFDVLTVDSKVDVNANTATLSVLLEVTVFAFVPQAITYFADSDDVFVKKCGAEILQSAEVVNLPLVIDEDLVATKSIDNVLLAESALSVCDYTLADGVLRVSGDATIRLTYISDELIVTDSLPFKFDRELDATEIPQEGRLTPILHVKNTKVRLNIAEDSVNTDFSVEIAATLQVEYAVTGVVEVATDAYGADCDFAFTRQSVTSTLPCQSVTVKKQVVNTLPAESGKTLLTAVNVGAVVTKCTSLEKYAQVEGVIFATALYSTESGTESSRLELPFVQKVEMDCLAPQCVSKAHVAVLGFALADNGALQATADLCICLSACKNVGFTVITEAQEKPFDKAALSAIEVCLAHKGETLWELAKSLHLSEDELLAMNPEISNPLERDARIVVFNKI